jgi:uncharacterized protein involved in response to NO
MTRQHDSLHPRRAAGVRGPGRSDARPQPAPAAFALWNLGVRPFDLLASACAAVSILLWVAQYAGYLPVAYVTDPLWHAHEMLFGYAIAIIAGFLFTAGRNWTGQPTPTGVLLAGYALLWFAGRVAVLLPYPWAAAVLNAAFPVAVGAGLAVPLARSGNRRNYFFVALLVLLGGVAFAIHLARLGIVALPAGAGIGLGLDIVLFVIAVMGGRVIPMFTNNGVPGTRATRHPLVEKAALGGVLALIAVDVLQPAPAVVIAVAGIAAIAHAIRLALWQPWRTTSTPLVWILHASYAWVVVYLVLRAADAAGHVATPLATHALTIGAIGGMTIGMMTRTARGHSGRPLVADRFELACYVLIQAAALVRVFGGIALPQHYRATVIVSGLCWSAGFALYAIRYWPILTRPRLDGEPG